MELFQTLVRDAGGLPSVPRVRAAAATGLCDALRQVGAAPDPVLVRARLRAEDLDDPRSWLSLSDYCELLEQASASSHSSAFGLRLGLMRSTELLGDVGSLAISAPTLYGALDAITRHFAVLQEQTAVTLMRQADRIVITYQIRNGHIIRRRQDAELSIGALIGCIRLCLGPQWAPQEVHFEHARPSRIAEHDALLGAPVYFGRPRNAIVIAADDGRAIMPSPDPVRCAELERHIGGGVPRGHATDFVGLVLQEIRDAFARGNPGVETVARKLDLSPPVLYRRLKACGVDFSDLQRDLRRDLALLSVSESHLPLTEIALALGYSELSAFSRAFRTWTGVSPNFYRRRWSDRSGSHNLS